MGKWTEAAKVIRGVMDTAGAMLTDEQAVQVKTLYKPWKPGVEYAEGKRLLHKGELYRVRKKHTSQSDWAPGVGTESLYTRIDKTHAGTKEDPIPYAGNMELKKGLYYSQDGVVYLCIRDTGIPVYNALSDLVGNYVEVTV